MNGILMGNASNITYTDFFHFYQEKEETKLTILSQKLTIAPYAWVKSRNDFIINDKSGK